MYDLVIIGSGPGGYPAAVRAASRGLKVAVIEKNMLGGECLNWGCIPTKVYLEASSMLKKVKLAGRMGIKLKVEEIDYGGIVKFRKKIVKGLAGGIGRLFKARGIELINAEVVDIGKNQVVCEDGTRIDARDIIIATGSEPREFEDFPFGGSVYSNRSIFDLDFLPKRMVILGGGIMGVEFATFFSQLGVKVTVIEFLDSLLTNFSTWISKEVQKVLKRNKVKFIFSDTVKSVKETSEKDLKIKTRNGVELESDLLLVTVGRDRKTGFLKGKVQLDEKTGRILVDDAGRTSMDSVWAVGDVASELMLAHNATFQGLKVVDVITRGQSSVNLDFVPSVVFTNPAFSVVGVTEGDSLKFSESSYMQTGISAIKGATAGKVRIYAEADSGIIRGAEIYGEGAAELIMHLVNAVVNSLTVKDLAEMVYPHPTLGENILEACEDMFGEAIHKVK